MLNVCFYSQFSFMLSFKIIGHILENKKKRKRMSEFMRLYENENESDDENKK